MQGRGLAYCIEEHYLARRGEDGFEISPNCTCSPRPAGDAARRGVEGWSWPSGRDEMTARHGQQRGVVSLWFWDTNSPGTTVQRDCLFGSEPQRANLLTWMSIPTAEPPDLSMAEGRWLAAGSVVRGASPSGSPIAASGLARSPPGTSSATNSDPRARCH